MNEYVPYGNTFILIWNVFIHITLHSFWSGFPIVLVGTFNKAKDIKASSLNIVFREIVLTPLCWHMPGSGNWCVLQDVALFAGAVRV